MFSEFKAFIARGNVLDLAIAVILGAAFGKIITTFTDGIFCKTGRQNAAAGAIAWRNP